MGLIGEPGHGRRLTDPDPTGDERMRPFQTGLDQPGMRRKAVGTSEGPQQAVASGTRRLLEIGQGHGLRQMIGEIVAHRPGQTGLDGMRTISRAVRTMDPDEMAEGREQPTLPLQGIGRPNDPEEGGEPRDRPRILDHADGKVRRPLTSLVQSPMQLRQRPDRDLQGIGPAFQIGLAGMDLAWIGETVGERTLNDVAQ